MNRIDTLKRLTSVNVWASKGQRAPHKPLLVLLALARCQQGKPREVSYLEVEAALKPMLREFGPPRKNVHPEYPFWHLQSDRIWTVRDGAALTMRRGHNAPLLSDLKKQNPTAGLTAPLHDALRKDPTLIAEAAQSILAAHFVDSLHADILAAVGLDLEAALAVRALKAKRDPTFRERVLRAYERRCAVCGFDLRLGGVDVALEAAHIKWHQAGGPDEECNGLALCSLHHKLLDRGAFTVTVERRVVVSQDVAGNDGVKEHLLRYHEAAVREPQSRQYRAKEEYLSWHGREVFRGPGRQR
jgi:putative restriction endonuclease